MGAVENNEVVSLEERRHAARKALAAAYDRRDALAKGIAAAEAAPGGLLHRELILAFGAAMRDVSAAEAEMKDAEYALASARTVPPIPARSRRPLILAWPAPHQHAS
jgi:hypothetical protein